MKELVDNMKNIIEDTKGVLIRGFDGTDKLGLAYRFLADIFRVEEQKIPKIIRGLDKWNLMRRKMEFLDVIRSERGGRGVNADPRLIRRGKRAYPDLDPSLYKRFVSERLNDHEQYWDMIEDFDSLYIVTLGDMISLIPEKIFYLIVRQADYYSNQTLCLALDERDTPFYDTQSGRLKVPSNLRIVAISPQYYSDKSISKIFHSIILEIDEKKIEDVEKLKLMRLINQLLDEEISEEFIHIGEKYFTGKEPVQQTIIDLEPILFDIIPKQTKLETGKSISKKEVYTRIMEKIKEDFNG